MTEYRIKVTELSSLTPSLYCGDKVFLSGCVYTARDAAHKRLVEMISAGVPLPFDIKDAVIYYAGPTPSKPDGTVGSFGPTTSARMDAFAPLLLDMGLKAMIGKGNRNTQVRDAIVRNSAVYFCAGGGLGALIADSIVNIEEVAFPELGCESVKRLDVINMPLYTAIDCRGDCIFDR